MSATANASTECAAADPREIGARATDYIGRGFAVFPLAAGSKMPHRFVARDRDDNGKPIDGTGGVKKATKDPAVARDWFQRDPAANIAIATGARSGFDALDIDVGKGGPDSLDRLIRDIGLDGLPETWVQHTPSGGRHVCFMHNAGLRNWTDAFGPEYPGLDIRTTDGFIAAEPSARGGRPYTWDFDANPDSIDLAPWPPALLERLLAEHPEPAPVEPAEMPDVDRGVVIADAKRVVAGWGRAKEGEGGSAQTFGVACRLVREFPLDEAGLVEVLTHYSDERCDPPWSDAEIAHKAADAKARECYRGGYTRGSEDEGTRKRLTPWPDKNTPIPAAWAGLDELTERGNGMRLAWRLQGIARCVPGWSDDRRWQLWDGRCFANGPDVTARLHHLAGKVLADALPWLAGRIAAKSADEEGPAIPARFRTHCGSLGGIRNALELASQHATIRAAAHEFNARDDLLNVANGVLEIASGRLLPHDPKYLFTRVCPASYKPSAKAPTFARFLRQITKGQRDLADRLKVQAGVTLLGGSRAMAYALDGPTGTGKSAWLNILSAVLGDGPSGFAEAVRWLSFGEVRGTHRPEHDADLEKLHGARAALCYDAPNRAALGVKFKSLVTDPTVSYRAPYGRSVMSLHVRCSIWFATNEMPALPEGGASILRRLVVTPLEQQFSTDGELLRAEPDRYLPVDESIEKRICEAERDGVLAWMVAGAQEYLQTGALPHAEAATRAQAGYGSDQAHWIDAFLDEVAELPDRSEAQAAFISTDDLYRVYVAWARDAGKRPLPKAGTSSFGAVLREAVRNSSQYGGDRIRFGQRGPKVTGRVRPRGVRGIRLSEHGHRLSTRPEDRATTSRHTS